MRFGAGVSVATTKVYQSPEVTYDAPDLDTIGVELFTIPTDSIILRMWFKLTTPFTNDTDNVSQDTWALMTDGEDAMAFGFSYGLSDDLPDITQPLDSIGVSVKLSPFPVFGGGALVPWQADEACTFYQRMSFVDDATYDPPTQGSLTYYALVTEVGAA